MTVEEEVRRGERRCEGREREGREEGEREEEEGLKVMGMQRTEEEDEKDNTLK